MKTIVTAEQIPLIIKRLAYCIAENHPDLTNTVFIGLQPRGVYFSNRLVQELNQVYNANVQYGLLDITMYRDDIHRGIHIPKTTKIDFSIEGKNVILIDDVLYTGRTIRAAIDALMDFGRPEKVGLCVLVDRLLTRELPIQPNFVGKTVDSLYSDKVLVHWTETEGKDEIILID